MLHYTRAGQGSPVVLVHGLFGSLSNLGLLAKHLVEQGFEVISLDALNHGQSPRSDSMHYQVQAQALIDTLAELGIGTCYSVGHSMGGKVCLAAAQLRPQLFEKVVAADIAPVAYQHSHQNVFNGLQAVDLANIESRKQAHQQLSTQVKEEGVSQFLLKSLQRVDEQWRWQFDVNKIIASYSDIIDWPLNGLSQVPTLFVKGGNSDYILPAHQAAVMAQYPKAGVKVIPDTGHWLHAEKPELFNRIVSRFLLNQG